MAWHIESKKNKGHTYYYARKNKWTKNGPRRAEEIYLGSADKIVEAMTKLPTEIVIETVHIRVSPIPRTQFSTYH